MNTVEKALEMNGKGFNCAQCVLTAMREYTELDEETALAIAAGFGGGVRSGEICGAISGGAMALGMAFPFTDAADLDAKQTIASLAAQLVSRAQEEYGAVQCRDLKGNGVTCDELIAGLARITEEMIYTNK